MVYLGYNRPTNIGNQVVAAFAGDPPKFQIAVHLGNERELRPQIFRFSIFQYHLSNCELATKSEGVLRRPFGELAWNDPNAKKLVQITHNVSLVQIYIIWK